MKKSDKRLSLRLGALALAAALLGTAALAAGGDQDDPLVTLSYLNKTAIPQIVKQVEDNTAGKQQELERAFAQQLQQQGQQGTAAPSGGASFTLVTLTQGQKLSLDLGCEVLLRVGTVTVGTDDNTTALVDMTSAETVKAGASLVKNHLYLASIGGRFLTASSPTVKVLVRGGCSLA